MNELLQQLVINRRGNLYVNMEGGNLLMDCRWENEVKAYAVQSRVPVHVLLDGAFPAVLEEHCQRIIRKIEISEVRR